MAHHQLNAANLQFSVNLNNTKFSEMLRPNQFKVNELWIAIKLNQRSVFVQDEPYDIYVLMDAASTYVFGHLLSRVADEGPEEAEVEALFRKAWETKRQWPEKLVVPERSLAQDVFKTQAEKHGFTFSTVRLADLTSIVGPVKKSFASALR